MILLDVICTIQRVCDVVFDLMLKDDVDIKALKNAFDEMEKGSNELFFYA